MLSDDSLYKTKLQFFGFFKVYLSFLLDCVLSPNSRDSHPFLSFETINRLIRNLYVTNGVFAWNFLTSQRLLFLVERPSSMLIVRGNKLAMSEHLLVLTSSICPSKRYHITSINRELTKFDL